AGGASGAAGSGGQSGSAGSSGSGGSAAGSGGSGGATCTEAGGAVWSQNGHCYFPLASSASWNVSRDNCSNKAAHLVTITSASEQSFVGALVGSSTRWIGLSRIGAPSFSWLGGEALSYTNWESGQPDASGESAALIRTGTLGWFDAALSEGHPSLCERE
ncbi:MAG TPA: C-type lectin domain-containing protein, partial [Polyangiales bacterium]|nr:C-type lectin domain-containing protein [Polyangiales bacterium]